MLYRALHLGTTVLNMVSVTVIVAYNKDWNVNTGLVHFFLIEGHHTTQVLKRLKTRYHHNKFDVCSYNTFEKNGNILFLPLTLTFGQGHTVIHNFKRIVTKNLCAKFGNCNFNSF